jgi:hypothetical protein
MDLQEVLIYNKNLHKSYRTEFQIHIVFLILSVTFMVVIVW